ncbi:MAG: YcaO-like family protein, partial [Kiloniellaceae bacterium]
IASRDDDSLKDDVTWELARLRAVGIEQVAAVDLTKPEFQVPVVRVVIPGLEGIDGSPKYQPGARARAVLEGLGLESTGLEGAGGRAP